MIKIAILVDGSFFIKRFRSIYRKNKENFNPYDYKFAADEFYKLMFLHINWPKKKYLKKSKGNSIYTNNSIDYFPDEYLYRIFYYDCLPLEKRVHNPIDDTCLNFEKTEEAKFRNGFINELKKKRKVALRLGRLKDHNKWIIKPDKLKKLLNKQISIDDLKPEDVLYDVTQKGVDMKIGLDIASLVYNKLVDKIILVSGDSDFVPAAKVARRGGIDFILDPMWNPIDPSLFEHIDGLQTTCSKP